MSLSRKHLEPLATMLGRAMLDAQVQTLGELPEPARTLAFDVYGFAREHAPNFRESTFDAWVLDVANGRRNPFTGARIKPVRGAA